MDEIRAKEIVSSSTMINVTCNGIPVYIENINTHNNTANVHPLNEPERTEEVSLSSLVEH